jgi:hypothetical protein
MQNFYYGWAWRTCSGQVSLSLILVVSMKKIQTQEHSKWEGCVAQTIIEGEGVEGCQRWPLEPRVQPSFLKLIFLSSVCWVERGCAICWRGTSNECASSELKRSPPHLFLYLLYSLKTRWKQVGTLPVVSTRSLCGAWRMKHWGCHYFIYFLSW